MIDPIEEIIKEQINKKWQDALKKEMLINSLELMLLTEIKQMQTAMEIDISDISFNLENPNKVEELQKIIIEYLRIKKIFDDKDREI